MEIDRIYLIDGEPYRLAQISASLGSLTEYTFVPATNMGVETDPHTNVVDAIIQYPITANAHADIVDTFASVPERYPITADQLTAAMAVVTPTDADGVYRWDPPRVNVTPATQYPEAMDGPIVRRRPQNTMADDPPELDLETTSVSRPDDGNVVLEGFRPLHPQIPTGDTYRIVQPNINIASAATTNIFSDNIVADSADSRWIDDQRAKYIEEMTKELNNILNKPAAEPIDNDAWDELFTPAT